jgi:hypothetical protein
MFNFGDREIGQDVLTSQKSLASCTHHASVEAVDPRLRQVLGQIHHQTVADAKQIFDYLHSRGWYVVKPASMHAVHDFVNTAQQARHEAMGITGSFGQVTGPVTGYVPGPVGTPMYVGQVGSTGHTGGGGVTLPDWTRHEVRFQGGNPGYGGQAYGGSTPVTGSLPQWARQDPQLGQFQQVGGGTVGTYQGGYGMPGSYGGYSPGLPAWTRQDVPSEQYRPGQIQPSIYQGYGGSYQAQQEGFRGGYTGYGTAGYTGQLPSWTRQDVRDTGYSAGGGNPGSGGLPAYPGGPTGVPVPSVYQGMGGAGQGNLPGAYQIGRGMA